MPFHAARKRWLLLLKKRLRTHEVRWPTSPREERRNPRLSPIKRRKPKTNAVETELTLIQRRRRNPPDRTPKSQSRPVQRRKRNRREKNAGNWIAPRITPKTASPLIDSKADNRVNHDRTPKTASRPRSENLKLPTESPGIANTQI